MCLCCFFDHFCIAGLLSSFPAQPFLPEAPVPFIDFSLFMYNWVCDTLTSCWKSGLRMQMLTQGLPHPCAVPTPTAPRSHHAPWVHRPTSPCLFFLCMWAHPCITSYFHFLWCKRWHSVGTLVLFAFTTHKDSPENHATALRSQGALSFFSFLFFFFLVRKTGPELTSIANLPLFAWGRLSLN